MTDVLTVYVAVVAYTAQPGDASMRIELVRDILARTHAVLILLCKQLCVRF